MLNILLLNLNIACRSLIHYSFLKIFSMKKIFTLLFSLTILGSAFAQAQYVYSRPADHAVTIKGKYYRYAGAYSFSRYERDLQLAKANQSYNTMLKGVINMRFLNAAEKLKLIRMI